MTRCDICDKRIDDGVGVTIVDSTVYFYGTPNPPKIQRKWELCSWVCASVVVDEKRELA